MIDRVMERLQNDFAQWDKQGFIMTWKKRSLKIAPLHWTEKSWKKLSLRFVFASPQVEEEMGKPPIGMDNLEIETM